MVKRLFLLLLALVFTLCVSGCGIDSEEVLIREIIEMREIPEGSSGEVIHQEQEGDYERMLVLFHGGTYLEVTALSAILPARGWRQSPP